jgi:hypothetical protein
VARQVLRPARSLPLVALCSQPLTVYQDGNAGPILCSNGALNVSAWKYFVPLGPRVLGAGPTASLGAVQKAICRDWSISHATDVQERTAYELAAAYYGWSFSTEPADILSSGCP